MIVKLSNQEHEINIEVPDNSFSDTSVISGKLVRFSLDWNKLFPSRPLNASKYENSILVFVECCQADTPDEARVQKYINYTHPAPTAQQFRDWTKVEDLGPTTYRLPSRRPTDDVDLMVQDETGNWFGVESQIHTYRVRRALNSGLRLTYQFEKLDVVDLKETDRVMVDFINKMVK